MKRYETSAKYHSKVSYPRFIRTINNQEIQQQLCNQLIHAVRQAKSDMIHLCVKTVDNQMHQYDQQFQKAIDAIGTERQQKSLVEDQQLTSIMLKMLEERIKNRKERIRYVNQYKLYCLRLNKNEQ